MSERIITFTTIDGKQYEIKNPFPKSLTDDLSDVDYMNGVVKYLHAWKDDNKKYFTVETTNGNMPVINIETIATITLAK